LTFLYCALSPKPRNGWDRVSSPQSVADAVRMPALADDANAIAATEAATAARVTRRMSPFM
jgi:hypothetical protein